jgi:site-specific recombinase XerD
MPRTRKSGDGGLYYDKKRDLWIGVFDNGTKPDGSRKQVRVSARLLSVARDKMDAKKAEIKTNHGQPLGNQTVNEWAPYWLEHIQRPKMKPGPWRTYSYSLNNWILPVIGKMKVKEVRPSDLRRVYDRVRLAGNSSATALKAHIVMSSMFEAARLEGITVTNVSNSITPPKAGKTTRGTFEPEQTLSILERSTDANTCRHGTKWQVSLYAGIRQGERLGATVDSVDFTRGLFTVQWNLVEGNYEHGCAGECTAKAAGWCPQKRLVLPEGMDYRVLHGRVMLVPPKSGESRTFPLPVSLLESLARHIADLENKPNPHGLLWPAEDGKPMTSREDQAEWKALLVASGVDIPAATTHWARHTMISDSAAEGVPDRTIGDTVGHRSPGVTGNYTHLSRQDSVEAMGKLEARRKV